MILALHLKKFNSFTGHGLEITVRMQDTYLVNENEGIRKKGLFPVFRL